MREDGILEICDPQRAQPLLRIGTVACVHCGMHFPVRPGSGKVRGFCTRCMGPVCGPGCAECVPIERRLDNEEAGKPPDYRRILVPSGALHARS